MTRKKRVVALFLAMLLMFSCVPSGAFTVFAEGGVPKNILQGGHKKIRGPQPATGGSLCKPSVPARRGMRCDRYRNSLNC